MAQSVRILVISKPQSTIKKESYLVFDFSEVNLIKCSLHQGERKLRYHIFPHFLIKHLGIELVVKV